MDNDAQLEQMKREMLTALRLAEKLAYAYFCACPVGDERIRAYSVYENILNSTRI